MALPVRREDRTPETAQRWSGWDPFAELERLTSQLDRIFGDWASWPVAAEGFTPLADIEETDDAFIVEVELPGVRKEDVDIEISGRRLVVTGERAERERVGVLRRRRRVTGRFHYEVVLPTDVDDEHVTAELADGVLTIRVPKAESHRARKIKVS